jgi:molecular chaperone DnaK (HSP70)
LCISIEKCRFENKDIDEVILVGGSTRIPAIQEAVENSSEKHHQKE